MCVGKICMGIEAAGSFFSRCKFYSGSGTMSFPHSRVKLVSNQNLYLVTHSPPLRHMLDYLSTRYATRLLFAVDRPLQQYFLLSSRKTQQRWLNSVRPAQKERTVNCSSLFKLLPLLTRFLKGTGRPEYPRTGAPPHHPSDNTEVRK